MVKLWFNRFFAFDVFIYNLSANVGTRSPNKTDDVQLVQLGFRSMALSKEQTFIEPESRLIYAQVPWGPDCSGTESDPLVVAIRHYQSVQPLATQDGHISVMATHDAHYKKGQFTQQYGWSNMILAIIEVHRDVWPNIQRIDGCPTALARSASNIMGDLSV